MQDFKRRFWVSLALTIPVLALSPMIRQFLGLTDALSFAGDSYVLFALSTVIFFYGGRPFLKGLVEEVGGKQPGMMTLIAVAITMAYVYSGAVVFGFTGRFFFWELATLIDVMLVGHWIEMRSVMSASRALEELAEMMPRTAHRINEGVDTEDVDVDELQVDDRVLVKPGEKIPADGVIYEGESEVDQSMVTGESEPAHKQVDDEVVGGTINGEGSLKVKVEKVGGDSFLQQVIELVRTAQEEKSKTQGLADKAAFWLTMIALTAGGITFAVWLLPMQKELSFAVTRAVTVMVITCPHALGLAIPLVVAVSTSKAAANGLMIRNRNAFEQARNLSTVIFDKTGTLTRGEFGVKNVEAFDEDLDKEELLTLAASVEAESEHPLARAIAEEVEERKPVENFQSITGKGVQGVIDGQTIHVVSKGYLDENDIKPRGEDKATELLEKGRTVVNVVVDGKVKGLIALADLLRDTSRQAVDELHDMGIRVEMLTGDRKRVAQWVADELGLDDYHAEVKPDDKADTVKQRREKADGPIAMVGDGVNDAPALATADVGIAIGAGADVAAETADIILVQSNPLDVVALIKLARATHSKMIQNLWWASGYNIIAIPLAAGVLAWAGILMNPAVGAALMSLSTVIVAVNARFLSID